MFHKIRLGALAVLKQIGILKNIRKSKVLSKYLISFILVFIVPSMFIVLFYNSYTTNMMVKKVEDEINTKFTKSSDEIDKRLMDTKDLIVRLTFDEETIAIGNAASLDSDILFRMSQYSKTISRFCIFSNYVKSVAVYYNKWDMLITSTGKDGVYNYFNRFSKVSSVSSEDMNNLLKNQVDIQIVPKSKENKDFTEVQVITAAESFPINEKKPIGSIVMLLDRAIFSQNLTGSEPKAKDNFLVIDENKNILTSNRNSIISKDTLLGIIKSEKLFSHKVMIDGKSCAVLCTRSNVLNLWYMYYLPEEEIAASVYPFKRLMTIVIVLYIAGGLCMAFFVAFLNYNPVKILMKEIKKKDSGKLDNTKLGKLQKDEYGIIKEYIEDLNNEKNNLSSKISAYLTEVKSNFLRELLIEGLEEDKFLETSIALDLRFNYPKYCFMYFNWNRLQNLSTNDVNNEFYILSLIEELATGFGMAYKFNLQKDIVGFILNLNEEANIKNMAEEYTMLVDSVNNNFNKQIKIGLGNIYDGFDKIPASYNESIEANRYGMFYDCKVFTYEDVVETQQNKYYYPAETMDKLVNYVESCNDESMECLLSNIIESNFKDKRLSMNSVNKLYYDLMGTLKRVIERHNIDITDITFDGGSINRNDDFKSLDDMIFSVKWFFKAVCNNISQNKEKVIDDTAAQIIEFIKGNYYEASLSCSSIADKFHVSQPYISNIIKKYSGMSYVDYVNHLRLDEAKNLLSKSSLNITEIACKLGYGSSNSFIRTFKSYEGITPGQYKNSFNI